MMRVSFYQVAASYDRVLCQLIGKIYSAGNKLLVCAVDETQQELINSNLWLLGRNSFVPHGSAKDLRPNDQPVYITTSADDNPNKASILILTSAQLKMSLEYARVMCIYSAENPVELKRASALMHELTSKGHEVDFFEQDSKGKWL